MTCHCCSGPTKRSGRFRNQNRTVQRFKCLKCNKTFSEPQPLQGVALSHDKAVQVIKFLTEGVGVRAAARLVGCHSFTVLNVLRTAGEQCEAFHNRFVRNLTVQSLQLDELHARVGVSQHRTTPADPDRGAFYTFLALTAREKFIVGYHTGKRDYANTNTFVADVASRISGRVQITADGWAAYPDTIRRHLLGRLDLAICQKNYAAPPIEVEAARRYSPAPFVGVTIQIRAGAPQPKQISTSYVERINLSMRHYNKRFVRLGMGWSRKLENHKAAISIFVAVHNFCRVHSTLGCTPAVGMKLTDHTWSIEELVESAAGSD